MSNVFTAMPRKSRSYDKHTPLPDPKFGSVKYAKFINYMMERGKKNTARQIFYDALEIVTEKMTTAPRATPAPAATDFAKASSVKKATDDKAAAKSDDGKVKPAQKVDGR